MGTSSSSWAHLPLHGHIFLFMGTSSPSLAHLPLHWHIFPFIGTSSPSSAHLLFHGHVESFPQVAENSFGRAGGGGVWAGHGLLPRELSRGFRRDTRGTLSEKTPNQIHGALAYAKLPRRKPQRLIPDLLTQIAYAKIIVKLPQNAYARLREPVNTNVSASAGLT